MNNQRIFQYFKPLENTQFSSLRGNDLQDLIVLIMDTDLEMRSLLGFEDDITFGLEIEFENAHLRSIKKKLKELPLENWSLVKDGSLRRGREIDSPILRDKIECWKELKMICDILKRESSIKENAASHVHIGAQILEDKKEYWLNFLNLWSAYENVILRFCYGSFLNARQNILNYASLMALNFASIYKEAIINDLSLEEIKKLLTYYRHQAVNFRNVNNFKQFQVGNTIEFRCPNGTLDPVIWQNNVNLFVNLLKYSKRLDYAYDIIEETKEESIHKYAEIKWSNEIFLNNSLVLSDLIFSNNLDKIYFLKQYLKNFEVCKDNKKWYKSRALVRNSVK